MVKNPNWREADQLAIYKRGRGVELGAAEKQLPLAVRAGLEPGTSGFQVRRPNPLHYAASLIKCSELSCLSCAEEGKCMDENMNGIIEY